jgi:hypothetical protein
MWSNEMTKILLAPVAALVVLGFGSMAMAQDATTATEQSAQPPRAQREWRGGAPGGQLTTATLERQFSRRLQAWEAAKIPAEKIEKAKEVQAKMRAALEAGNQNEVRALNRSLRDLLTEEERQAVNQQMRTAGGQRWAGGNDASTTGGERSRNRQRPE